MEPLPSIYFYRESDAKWGCFSNFHKTAQPLRWQGASYPTSEHLYQALKFIYDGADAATLAYAEIIRTTKTPNMAKLYARMELTRARFGWQEPIVKQIAEFRGKAIPRSDWERCRVDVMLRVLHTKFTQDKLCRETLMSSEGFFLAEHTENDKFWGDGGDQYNGKNYMGRLLMDIRQGLLIERRKPPSNDTSLG